MLLTGTLSKASKIMERWMEYLDADLANIYLLSCTETNSRICTNVTIKETRDKMDQAKQTDKGNRQVTFLSY